MQIQLQTTYAAAPEHVRDVLLSEPLARARMSALGVPDFTFTRQDSDTLTQTRLHVRVPAAQLPAQVRGFVKSGLTVVVTSTAARSPQNAARSRNVTAGSTKAVTISHQIAVTGAPVTGQITMRLTPAATAPSTPALNTQKGAESKSVAINGTARPSTAVSPSSPEATTPSSSSGATAATIQGEFSVHVPFIGARIEAQIAKYAQTVLKHDTAQVNALLR